jgi:hypothetical protein
MIDVPVRKEEAIRAYDNAMIAASTREADVRKNVREIYKKMGYTEGVQKIDAWLAENAKAEKDNPPTQPMGLTPPR